MMQQTTLTTLRAIHTAVKSGSVKGDSASFSTLGLIIDCANPHRKDPKKDYLMRVKIFDPSISINEPVTIFLYAREVRDFPSDIAVGDVLYLNKYNFEIWNDTLQAKRGFKVPDSFSRFFTGDSQVEGYGYIDGKVGMYDDDRTILSAINDLRKYSRNYFKNHPITLVTKSSKNSSDFDLILEVKSSTKLNNCFNISMSNSANQFQLNYTYPVASGIYKVRSVADMHWNNKICHLVGNDYTFFMRISPWMKSYHEKEWEKVQPTGKQVERKERARLETKILNERRGNARSVITLKQLISKDTHEEEVRVSVQFVEVFNKFTTGLRRYDSKNHIEKPFLSQAGDYIYNLHFAVTDNTLEGEIFNVYLYTFDGRGLQFMPELDPKGIYGRNITDYEEKFTSLVNRLLEETDAEDASLQIVLSPMFNGRETIYRIVDTELLV